MTVIDLSILGILLLSAGISFLKGFVRELMSLAAWVVALWVAINYTPALEGLLAGQITSEPLRSGAAFMILFISCLIAASLLNRLMVQLVKRTGFSGTDRMLGMLFGLARGGIIVAVLILLAGLTEFPLQPWWQESILLNQFEPLALWLRDFLPADIASRFVYRS